MSQEVRDDYLESLEELTVNSRPIIKTLTEIALENVVDARAVVDAIEAHTLRCSPNYKLPALYLIDSICKNIGEPYNSLLTARIVGIFSAAFSVAPEPVRVKLNELFKTWTVPIPATGEPLFPHEALRQLNDFLVREQLAHMPKGAAENNMAPASAMAASAGVSWQGRPRLNQSALMVEMNRFRQQLEGDNNDQHNERQLQLLARLEAQISGVVDPKLLPEIQNNLEEMRYEREQYLLRPQSASSSRRHNQNGHGGGGGGGRRGGGENGRRHGSSASNKDSTGRDRKASGGVGKITGTNNVPLGTRKTRSAGSDSLALAKDTLEKAGSPPTAADKEIASLDLATACDQPASDLLIEQLYSDGLPLQCSTCGYRFKDTPEGRAAKEAEMDWHFRANKDIREGHSRNRCWFLVAVSWVAYRDEDEVFGLGSSLATGAGIMSGGMGGGSAGAEAALSAPVDLEKEREKYVEVPLESNVVCPVCGEPHETSWSEEAENWVWMNTVEVDGHYFHATCYADPQNRELVASILESKA